MSNIDPTQSGFAQLDPEPRKAAVWPQTLVGVGVLLTGLALAWGATGISSEAGYGGVGPNFLPWLVSVALIICGAWITWEARTGGFREMDAPDDIRGEFKPIKTNVPGLDICEHLAHRHRHRPADLRAGLLDVHQVPGHQPAGPHRLRMDLTWTSSLH